MVPVNRISNKIQLIVGSISAILSTVFLINQSWMILILCIISLFMIVGTVPLFRKRESLYMFILVALAGLPINIRLSYWLVSEGLISSGFLIGNILWLMLLCCVFCSVEEIVFGIIARMIWRRQYKVKITYY